jgi:carboxyl-terminal processing protease
MEQWQKVVVACLTAAVAGFGLFSAGFAMGERREDPVFLTGGDGSSAPDVISQAYEAIISSAVDAPSAEAIARGAVKGMIGALKNSDDAYAYFYSPRAYRDFQQLTTGKFSGIGVWLKIKDEQLEIVSVLPGTPALAAGLKRGDVIAEVDGKTLGGLTPAESDAAVNLIKGPEGTKVSLEVKRGAQTLSFDITRAEIVLPNLTSRITEDGLGYIQLLGFARDAGEQVRAEVKELTDKGAEGIILDLRDNGGGLFPEAISVSSVFIEDGPVVIYRDGGEEDVTYDAEGSAFEDLPLVVLVNEGTASASEIVAGALQDRDRAVVVGVQTYGKGSVQEVVPLPDDSAFKLTTAAYLTPSGRDINGKGIAPDVKVEGTPAVQYDRAVEVLKGMVLSSTGGQG